MLRILIVDDEPFFLEFMESFFQTQNLECRIVGTAPDGLKAMEILKSQPVDVIFTDIKMPVMDGLELICSAMELDPGYQFVVLSSYSDFHMVGQAFKLGAKEYVLKSEMTAEQICDILLKCEQRKKEQLLEQQKTAAQKQRFAEMSAQLSDLQQVVDSNRDALKKKFFRDILQRDLTFSEARERSHAPSFLPETLPTVALLVRISDYHRVLRDTWNNDSLLLEFAFTNIFEEICTRFRDTVCFCGKPDEYLLFTSSENSSFDLKYKAYDISIAVRQALRSSLLMETIISVSSPGDGEEKTVQQMYGEASQLNDLFFLLGKDELITPERAAGRRPVPCCSAEAGSQAIARFRELLASRDIRNLQSSIALFQVQPEGTDLSQISRIRSLFSRYAFHIQEYAAENELLPRFQKELDYYEQYLQHYGTLQEMNEWLEQTVTVLLQQEFHSSSLVRRVKKYVLANYYRDISLTEIAQIMEVNPNYLSRAFSKEYGDSLISYINSVRLQAASSLLKNTNLKNYEIADRVGYQSVEHFCRVFKKMTGCTPGEYRNQQS